MNDLIFLGTGGAESLTRQMTSLLFTTPDHKFLIDCGDGMGTVRNIVAAGVKPESVKTIFLTHHHADHIIGLTHLLFIQLIHNEKGRFSIYGPPETLKVAQDICYSTHDFTRNHRSQLTFTALESGQSISLNQHITVTSLFVRNKEKDPMVPLSGMETFAYKAVIDNTSIVFSSDMRPSDEFTEFSHDADILIHECFDLDIHKQFVSQSGHSTARDGGETAANAKAKKLFLTHFRDEPIVSYESLRKEAQKYYDGDVVIAQDLLSVSLD